jgi:hypothetical protein
MTGRQKKEGNQFPPNNKLVQEPEGNEKNKCPDPDSNKTKINYAKDILLSSPWNLLQNRSYPRAQSKSQQI